MDPSAIKNKIKRNQIFQTLKSDKTRTKLKTRLAQKQTEKLDPTLKEKRILKNVPQTLENQREKDITIIGDDQEVITDQQYDQFANYFVKGLPPKILITTSKRPSASAYEFAKEFKTIFPDSEFVKRGSQFDLKRIVEIGIEREYTDIMVINEDRKIPNQLTVIHLPNGPTAHFKLSSIKLNKDIRGHGKLGPHNPELILNHFNTRLGHTIGRMIASLFPSVPEFTGRQVATFHNQRDFIFFRRHRYQFFIKLRYIFRNGERCDIQELGPRFTLKLKWLQKGTFDTKGGEYEFMHKPELDTTRRKFFL
jgi:ribosome production factor 1